MTQGEGLDRSVVARFASHDDAEEAVRTLENAGIPMTHISIIGRDFRATPESARAGRRSQP